MARPVTPRPPSEHIRILGRVSRQVEIDSEMSSKRRQAITDSLADIIDKLTHEEAKRAK